MTLKFLKSALMPSDWLNDTRKEVALIGRSNTGKSSLINAMFNTDIVRTSNTPGRTRLINFFDTNGKYRIIDLPGYGYSKINAQDSALINKYVTHYLRTRINLTLIVLVVDINVITNKDQEMVQVLKEAKHPFIIALNKTDKLAKSYFDNHQQIIAQYLDVDSSLLIPVSAVKKTNLNTLLAVINKSND
ncbi:ribosome biogenesis GTP-binding protein YsxC [bacterium]|nr:ribosome biogenesis GTP-binding protein YsxC [bacterium]